MTPSATAYSCFWVLLAAFAGSACHKEHTTLPLLRQMPAPVSTDLQSFDYGWHLGGGIDLGNIGLHLRVSRSLQDIRNENTFEEFFGSLKNASWALTASYGF